MIDSTLAVIYLFLPAIAANIAPVLADSDNLFPSLNKPLDKGHSYNNKRILGDNKTIRGVIVGTLAGALVGLLQGNLLLGLGMGLGALWGNAFKSLIKRRLDIKPGAGWMPWDQIDFVIGAIIVTWPVSPQPIEHYLIAIIILGAGSFLASYIGERTGIKQIHNQKRAGLRNPTPTK